MPSAAHAAVYLNLAETYERLAKQVSPLSGAAGEFFNAVRNDFRQLHHLLAQFGVFRNVTLNAVAIGLQFSPERLKLTEETINFARVEP